METSKNEVEALRAENKILREALKGTLWVFGNRSISKTDDEQLAFARAALSGSV